MSEVVGPTAKITKDKYDSLFMSLKDIGLDVLVKYASTSNGPKFSMIDVVMAVTGKNNKRASETLLGLSSQFYNEVSGFIGNIQFKGKGQKSIRVISLKGVIRLVMENLGGNAASIRSKFLDVLQKYFAGEPALVAEIAANYHSDAGINVLAREAEATENANTTALEDPRSKRRRLSPELEEQARLRRYQLYDERTKHSRAIKLIVKAEEEKRITVQVTEDEFRKTEKEKQKTEDKMIQRLTLQREVNQSAPGPSISVNVPVTNNNTVSPTSSSNNTSDMTVTATTTTKTTPPAVAKSVRQIASDIQQCKNLRSKNYDMYDKFINRVGSLVTKEPHFLQAVTKVAGLKDEQWAVNMHSANNHDKIRQILEEEIAKLT